MISTAKVPVEPDAIMPTFTVFVDTYSPQESPAAIYDAVSVAVNPVEPILLNNFPEPVFCNMMVKGATVPEVIFVRTVKDEVAIVRVFEYTSPEVTEFVFAMVTYWEESAANNADVATMELFTNGGVTTEAGILETMTEPIEFVPAGRGFMIAPMEPIVLVPA